MSDHRTTIRNNLLALVAGALALALALLIDSCGSEPPTSQEIAEAAYVCGGSYPMGPPEWRAHETCGGAP